MCSKNYRFDVFIKNDDIRERLRVLRSLFIPYAKIKVIIYKKQYVNCKLQMRLSQNNNYVDRFFY